MRNIPVLFILTFFWMVITTMEAQSSFLQGPNELYSAYPPILSQPLDALPQGFITISVGYETYYYFNGIFYQKIIRDQKYVLVPPPIGAIVFSIPQGYQLMLIDGVSYYEDKGVYYKRVLEGYKVIEPPAGVL